MEQVLKMLNALIIMVTLVEHVIFFPELFKIYKLCHQQGFLRAKIEDSLNEILPAFSVTIISVMEDKILKHGFFFLSCKLLLSAPQVSQ